MYFPKHNVAFVAINKTGSSSILQALNDALYDHDVAEIWRKIPGHRMRREHDILKHAQAYFYYTQLGAQQYADCYVFTQVRNPWDKMVSDFLFRCREPRDPQKWQPVRRWFVERGMTAPSAEPPIALFREFIQAFASGQQRTHRQWTSISKEYGMADSAKANLNQRDGLTDLEGNIIVNKVMRFESMLDDWEDVREEVLRRTSVALGDLPHLNKARRLDYRDYYDEQAHDTVARIFADDIRTFNYSFDHS